MQSQPKSSLGSVTRYDGSNSVKLAGGFAYENRTWIWNGVAKTAKDGTKINENTIQIAEPRGKTFRYTEGAMNQGNPEGDSGNTDHPLERSTTLVTTSVAQVGINMSFGITHRLGSTATSGTAQPSPRLTRLQTTGSSHQTARCVSNAARRKHLVMVIGLKW